MHGPLIVKLTPKLSKNGTTGVLISP